MREIATAIVANTVLTIARTNDAAYMMVSEAPDGDITERKFEDVREAFEKMGWEVRLLLHGEDLESRLDEPAGDPSDPS